MSRLHKLVSEETPSLQTKGTYSTYRPRYLSCGGITMHLLRLIIFLGVLVSAARLGGADAVEPDVTLFDALITKDVIAQEHGVAKPMEFSVTESEDGTRHFVFEYRFEPRNAAEHYVLDVAVAPAGRLLDPEEYRGRLASEKQAGTFSPADYPMIGSRARREIQGIGPGGAAYGLVFTTADGKFDIRVTISSLLPAGAEEPQIDLDRLALHLSERYNLAIGSVKSGKP